MDIQRIKDCAGIAQEAKLDNQALEGLSADRCPVVTAEARKGFPQAASALTPRKRMELLQCLVLCCTSLL